MRALQPEAGRGSQKRLQRVVARGPYLLQTGTAPIRRLSPLRDDGFAEYRDAAFRDRLGLGAHQVALRSFWPARGPQWDGLGWSDGAPVLVEAKAHLAEFLSPPSRAARASPTRSAWFRRLSGRSRAATGRRASINTPTGALLWWLHERGVGGLLLFVTFVGDEDVAGPPCADVWAAAFSVADDALGCRNGIA